MARKIDDVIVPERKRSIRNISVSEVRKEVKASGKHSIPKKPKSGFSYKRIGTAIVAALLVLGIALLSLFSGATLTYTPRMENLAFAGESFSAFKSGEGLIASAIKLSGEKGQVVKATGEENVSRKASGLIAVFNTGSLSQPLVENTRFESTDGKIFRTTKSISVPAKGSVEVEVRADAPGAEHNIGLTDFTLPGLKGTPKYSTVYGRSKTPMTGGFIGREKVVSQMELAKAKEDLERNLKEELLGKAALEVPEEFILVPALSSIIFEELPQSDAGADEAVTVNVRGNLVAIMFKKAELSRTLAKNKTELSESDLVEITSFDALEINFAGAPPTDLLNLDRIDFKVNGGAKLVWKTDEVALRNALVGRKKSDLGPILKNYPTIAKANASIRPFWKRSFPGEASKIVIKQDAR